MLSSDRLQLIAICCNRRGVWTAHLTRHILSHLHAHILMSHRPWLKFGVQRTFHSIPSSCVHDVVVLILCDSPFHFLLSLFCPIVLFILLVFTFFFHDVGRQVLCALSLMRTLAPLPSTTLSQVMSPTTCTSQRPLNYTPRNPPARTGPWTRMTLGAMTTPSAYRSLHHCSPRSGWIYFIDPEDKEFKKKHQECSQEVGNTNGSRYALQDKQEQSAWSDPWQNQWDQIKTCVYFGSYWIHKTAYGRIFTESSWRPYFRKRRQFTATLQFGAQIYS